VYFFDKEKTQYLICCTNTQAQEFHNAETLEMDLSFKMVAGKTSVFSISAWDEKIQRRYIIFVISTQPLLKVNL